jgi:ABC-type nitrate/sulfonate/bicarbonate transport system permease component
MLKSLLRLRGELDAKLTTTIQLVGLGLILGAWSLISFFELVPAALLPSPLSVLSSFSDLHYNDALVRNVLYSIKINLFGYFQALVIAIPLGFIVGLLPVFRELFRRYIDAPDRSYWFVYSVVRY